MNINNIIKKTINKFGYDLKNIQNQRTSIEQSYLHLRKLGFKPKTVIDVGVAKGTPELYSSFPDSFILLIEPLKECEKYLINILTQYNGTYILAAAGKNNGEVVFNVHNSHMEGSSIYKETMGPDQDGYEVKVPIVLIDDFLRDNMINGPYLIKIDVQGAELEALEGAKNALLQSEVVVLEVSLFEFMKGAPQLYDVVSYMKSHGFVAYDIIHGWNRPLDNALGQVDIVFVKDKGMFRKDHSYSKT